jgi:hypothetical protein
MLLHCPESLFVLFALIVCVPAVLHFHYMNRAAIELLDSIPLTALSFNLWLSGYRGGTCPTSPTCFYPGQRQVGCHTPTLVSWCPAVLHAVRTCN